MLLVGKLNMDGEETYLHWCSNKTNNRLTLFSRVAIEDLDNYYEDKELVNPVLTIYDINTKDIQHFEKYLIGSVITNKSLKDMKFCGEVERIVRFIKMYAKVSSKTFKKEDIVLNTTTGLVSRLIVRSEDEDFSYVKQLGQTMELSVREGNTTFKSEYNNETITSCQTIGKWEWIEDVNFKSQIRDDLKVISSRNLNQLRQKLNGLTWYFNPDGSSKKDYKVLHTLDEVKEVAEILSKCKLFALDCETTGLKINSLPKGNANKDLIVGMSLTWKRDQGIYIPFRHDSFENVDIEEALAILKPILETGNLVTHNGLFDGKVFWDNGIRLHIVHDTMIMQFNKNPTIAKGSKALKQLTRKRYNHETIELEDIFGKKSDAGLFCKVTEDVVKIYACADTDYTFQLALDMFPEIPALNPYYLDIKVLNELIQSEYAGNRVDNELLSILAPVNTEDLRTLEKLMFKYVGQLSKYTEATKILQSEVLDGKMTEEQMKEELLELTRDPEFKELKYEFGPSKPQDLKKVLYDVLGYKVQRVNKKSGQPSTDKMALEDLSKQVVEEGKEGNWLKEDIKSSLVNYTDEYDPKDAVLINAEKFNKCQHPFVLLLLKWKELEKLETNFYAWFKNDSVDNMYYAPFSQTNAETSRITNKVQTIKGIMKKLIVPYSKDYYMCVFDFAQIEYRVMAGLSGMMELVDMLENPRADFHRIGAALLYNITPDQVTKDQRKYLKSANFAIPYGMGARSLSESLYGRPVTKENIAKAQDLLDTWYYTYPLIKSMLDGQREFALELHEEKNHGTGEVVMKRFIMNKFGRRRYFSDEEVLENVDKARIERMSGNYPIQSYAAEIFKTAFVKFRTRLRKEGLEDKVFTTALIHDELVNIVHKSVDPYYLYKIIMEEVMIHLKGHPTYYAGISICDNWYEGKDDLYEAPIEYVQHIISEIDNGTRHKRSWVDDPKKEVVNDIKSFMRDKYLEEFKRLQPDLSPGNVKIDQILSHFTDYFLKPKMNMYVGVYRKWEKNTKGDPVNDDNLKASIEKLLFDYYGVDTLTFKYDDGTAKKITLEMGDDKETPVIHSLDVDLTDVDLTELVINEEYSGDFDDEDYDDNSDFEMSVPINQYEREVEKEIVMTRKREVGDGKTYANLISDSDYETFDANDKSKLFERSNKLYIDVSNNTKEDIVNLTKYLNTKLVETGKGRNLNFVINGTITPTNYYIENYSKEEIMNILGIKLSDLIGN